MRKNDARFVLDRIEIVWERDDQAEGDVPDFISNTLQMLPVAFSLEVTGPAESGGICYGFGYKDWNQYGWLYV